MPDSHHPPTILDELAELALSLSRDQLRECGMATHGVLTNFLIEFREVLLAIHKTRGGHIAASASGTPVGAHGAKAGK